MIRPYRNKSSKPTQPPSEGPRPEMGHMLENLMRVRGCTVEIMQKGRLPHREVNGRLYTPPEFPLQWQHSSDMTDEQIAAYFVNEIMKHVNTARRANSLKGITYVTLRDAWRFSMQSQVLVSVLVV